MRTQRLLAATIGLSLLVSTSQTFAAYTFFSTSGSESPGSVSPSISDTDLASADLSDDSSAAQDLLADEIASNTDDSTPIELLIDDSTDGQTPGDAVTLSPTGSDSSTTDASTWMLHWQDVDLDSAGLNVHNTTDFNDLMLMVQASGAESDITPVAVPLPGALGVGAATLVIAAWVIRQRSF